MGENIFFIALLLLAIVFGKFLCGRICLFGLLQDLLHKIPFPLKIRKFKGEKILLGLKYVFLLFMVVSAVFGMVSEKEHHGGFSVGQVIFLGGMLLAFIIIYRPFCKFLCPYGAIASLLNLISPYRYGIDEKKCIDCNKCATICKMNVAVHKTPNHTECIRCGKCIKACPKGAICAGFLNKKK